jgi:hypothetical protein
VRSSEMSNSLVSLLFIAVPGNYTQQQPIARWGQQGLKIQEITATLTAA